MKKIIAISICCCALGLVSCYYQVTCPEFDEKILNWFPYQEKDVIELYSQSKDSTIIFSIKSVVVSHKTQYTFGTKCGKCDDEIEISQNNHDNFKFDIYISLSKNKLNQQIYRIGDTWFEVTPYTTNQYSELKNYLFESKEYDVVRIFEKTDSEGTFQKLIIAKDIGIVGLIDIYGNTWVLNPSAIKKLDEPDEQRNIVINNVSC